MMPVHRAGEAEREAGKLLLNGRYGRIDRRVPADTGQRADGAGVVRPEPADRGPAGGRVALVPLAADPAVAAVESFWPAEEQSAAGGYAVPGYLAAGSGAGTGL